MNGYQPLCRRAVTTTALCLLALAMAGCGTNAKVAAGVYQGESFGAEQTFSRVVVADAPTACRAARLALLSQGYVVSIATEEVVTGNKRFQPDGNVHVQITFTVTCAPEPGEPGRATVFVNAVQDRYAVKKATSSASIGLPLGSLSIPLTGSEDSLVRVGSETIPSGDFYNRFFSLVERYAESYVCEGGMAACPAESAASG